MSIKNILRPNSIKSLEACYKNYFSKLDNKKPYKITRKDILKALEPLIQSNKATTLKTAIIFLYELTATPKDSSNVIHYTNARELKQENMVKLPVILCNFVNVASVIDNAIVMQNRLEAIAKSENADLRPIVLFQAQSGANEDAQTFKKIKKKLVNIGIEKEQIAIKTAKINELDKIDLLDKDCKIRYIITINALKEGWDCPYAYILASIANKNSTANVEQLIGRVLRQPNAIKYKNQDLNMSYVLTCSNDFDTTAKSVIAGLNGLDLAKMIIGKRILES